MTLPDQPAPPSRSLGAGAGPLPRTPPLRVLILVCSVAAIAVGTVLGGSWSDRLGDHRGLYLVPVQEPLDPAARAALAPRLPRRTALVLIDGLGVEEASGMSSLASLRARGQCRRTYVGSLTVSQPMYAVVSTGLEADRTGVRNNEPPLLPLQAENLWSIARRAGLTVSGISELSWWERVLPAVGDRPSAFSSYLIRPRAENFFTGAAPGDIQIIHPIYVDEAGHDGGAASEGYRQAVRRADAELAGFARTLDLDRDLLVVTADHGHSLRGGHGGQQPRLAHVLTCYAGRGVRHLDAVGEMKSTSIAPSLALLLGLRFPMHMRAGLRGAEPDDDLDVLWQLVDPAAFPPEYLAERRRAVERFREENQRQLTTWTGGESELDHLLPAAPAGAAAPGPAAARDRGGSAGAAGGVAPSPGPGVVPLLHTSRDHGSLRSLAGAGLRSARLWDAALCAAWVVGIYLVTWVLIFAVRGSVDATAINKRAPFILFSFALSAGVLACAGALHVLLRRSLAALRADTLALLVVSTILNLGHPAVLGWTLGFPIPPSPFIFFPYFAAMFLMALGVLALPCASAGAAARLRVKKDRRSLLRSAGRNRLPPWPLVKRLNPYISRWAPQMTDLGFPTRGSARHGQRRIPGSFIVGKKQLSPLVPGRQA